MEISDIAGTRLGTRKNILKGETNGKFLADRNNDWRKALEEIYPSPYVYGNKHLIFLKGVENGRKVTTAGAGMAYDLYRLQCWRSPQRYLKIITTDKIVFAIFNVASDGAGEIRQMLSSSNWFARLLATPNKEKRNKDILFLRKKRKEEILFPTRIDIIFGSPFFQSIGRNIYPAILREADSRIGPGEVRDTFFSLFRRMQSRFMERGGGISGKMWVLPSEADESSALNRLMDEYKGAGGMEITGEAAKSVAGGS